MALIEMKPFLKGSICINEYGGWKKHIDYPVVWCSVDRPSLQTCHICTKLRTLVYFDIEATGLKSSVTCELTFLVVDTSDVLDLNAKMKNIT